jgi:hypothetical protein
MEHDGSRGVCRREEAFLLRYKPDIFASEENQLKNIKIMVCFEVND